MINDQQGRTKTSFWTCLNTEKILTKLILPVFNPKEKKIVENFIQHAICDDHQVVFVFWSFGGIHKPRSHQEGL